MKIVTIIAITFTTPVAAAAAADVKPGGDYSKFVRPFLAKHCFSCHGSK